MPVTNDTQPSGAATPGLAAEATESAPPAATATEIPTRRVYPKGLANLAFTEFWERFSFYGLQAVLGFYLLYALDQGGLALSPTVAASILGAYGGAIYLAQILGSWIGDRLLAPKWAVFWGGVVIALGHLALGFVPGFAGLGLGLGLIVLGTGALKTNITSIVGMVLDHDSARRDAGFAYFYMAINIGATVGMFATGWVQSSSGFPLAFTLAALGMFAALIQYSFGMRKLPPSAGVVRNPLPARDAWRPVVVIVGIAAVISAGWMSGLINESNLSSVTALVVLAAAIILFSVMFGSKNVTAAEKTRLAGFIPLFIASALFFGFLFQIYSVLPIMISAGQIDLTISGWEMPPAWVLSIGALASVLITPVIARFWGRRDTLTPSPARKFAFGMLQIGVGHAFLLIALTLSGPTLALVPVLVYVIIVGVSEVMVGPTGLSLASRIAPKQFTSQLVAMIFLTLALGSTIGGLLGQLYVAIGVVGFLAVVIVTSVAVGALLWVFGKRINAAVATGL